jgi:hypothetical protein
MGRLNEGRRVEQGNGSLEYGVQSSGRAFVAFLAHFHREWVAGCLHDDDLFFLLFLGIIRHWGMTDTQCRAVDINGSWKLGVSMDEF